MTAQYLMIDDKHRQMTGFLASLADFSLTSGEAVNAALVRTTPNISLYCLDDEQKRAIFVELPPDVDLAQAPFVYQTQYEQAQRLIAVPYERFRQIAQELPEMTHLIMIYITGRSGSTLVSHVLNDLDTVVSLSEPDVATQFVHMRSADGHRDAELRELLDCTVRFLFKPTSFKTPSTAALKLRNEGLQVMDLFQATFPHAKNLFLARDAIGFVTSFARILKRFGMPDALPVGEGLALFSQTTHYDLPALRIYLDADQRKISILQILTLWWLAGMEWYLVQYAKGIPILAVRYADLQAHQEQVSTAIFSYCGLPASAVHHALGVFGKDSQAGTALAREKPDEGNTRHLSTEQRQEITRILERHPVIQTSDFILPGTLRV